MSYPLHLRSHWNATMEEDSQRRAGGAPPSLGEGRRARSPLSFPPPAGALIGSSALQAARRRRHHRWRTDPARGVAFEQVADHLACSCFLTRWLKAGDSRGWWSSRAGQCASQRRSGTCWVWIRLACWPGSCAWLGLSPSEQRRAGDHPSRWCCGKVQQCAGYGGHRVLEAPPE